MTESTDPPRSQHAPPDFQLFTDGACLGNPGPGGWAFVLRPASSRSATDNGEIEAFGGEAKTTNNRMELTAVIEGLHRARRMGGPNARLGIQLCSDSEYVLRGIAEWMPAWKARGWRLSNSRKPVKNAELWQELDALLRACNVTTVWVRGHTGHPENERCDQLASAEAERWARGEGTPSEPRPSLSGPTDLLF